MNDKLIAECKRCGPVPADFFEHRHDTYHPDYCNLCNFDNRPKWDAKEEEITRLTAENAALVEALEFYADRKNYDAFLSTDFDGEPITVPRVMLDSGVTACKALKR